MQATVSKKIYRLSVDCVLDAQDRVWQARDVAVDTSGEIDLWLDTNPYDDRIYAYSMGCGWTFYNAKGLEIAITDRNIREFLGEIREAIPGGLI